MSDYRLLLNRKIIDVLIGDEKFADGRSLPYLSGPQLCDISTTFGLPKTYTWNGVNQSRWEYMRDLIDYLDNTDSVASLIDFLLGMTNMGEMLSKASTVEEQMAEQSAIVDSALNKINVLLRLSGKEIKGAPNYVISDIGAPAVITPVSLPKITRGYITSLPQRIQSDMESREYDSVVTKSRTLVEETCIFILEEKGIAVPEDGNVVKLFAECKKSLNMLTDKEGDARINRLIGSLSSIVSAIAEMRNKNSDAHGAGSKRINITADEAILIANSSVMLCDYLYSVFERSK